MRSNKAANVEIIAFKTIQMKSCSVLDVPISDLKLSDAFTQMATCNHFRNLRDIINWPVSVLLMHTGFSYHVYQELRRFLNENDLLLVLKT